MKISAEKRDILDSFAVIIWRETLALSSFHTQLEMKTIDQGQGKG